MATLTFQNAEYALGGATEKYMCKFLLKILIFDTVSNNFELSQWKIGG